MTDNNAIQKASPNVDDVDALVRRTMFKGQPADLVNMTLLICQRYGLDPLLKHVVLISGNVYVTRDGLLHVAHQSGEFDGMNVTLGKDDFGMYAEGTVYRRDMSHPFTYRVYRDEYDSKRGAWKTHPRAMLVKTAEVFTLRRAFDVALTPIEEMDTVIEGEVVQNTAPDATGAPETGPTQEQVQSHWIDEGKVRAKFWAYVKNDAELSEQEVYEALGVASIHEFEGTMHDAKELIDSYAEMKRLDAEEAEYEATAEGDYGDAMAEAASAEDASKSLFSDKDFEGFD